MTWGSSIATCVTRCRGDFNATLKDLGIYKYTVQISGYPDLDPIIIVDK
jgi:hypothetical protein